MRKTRFKTHRNYWFNAIDLAVRLVESESATDSKLIHSMLTQLDCLLEGPVYLINELNQDW